MPLLESITNHGEKKHAEDDHAKEKYEVEEDQDGMHMESLRLAQKREPAAFFVFAIRETATMQFFLLCARNFG